MVRALITTAILLSVTLFAAVTPVGRVNGVPVFKEDLARIPQDNESRMSAFDRLVLFRLAVEQARKEKLDQAPEVKHELDLVVYRQFLNKRLKAESQKLSPTNAEIKVYYEQRPLLRLRHLVLRFNTPQERTQAAEKADRVDSQLKAGRSFASVAEEFSEDDTAQVGGDIGERGMHNLHEDFYLKALPLQSEQISSRIESRTGIHYFQMVSRIPYASAHPTYITYLTKQLSQDRENRFLTSVLTELKRNAKIEILQSARND